MDSVKDIWNEVLKALATKMTQTSIAAWFDECEPVAVDGNTFIIHESSDFKKSIILARYSDIIREVLSDIFSCDFELRILGDEEKEEYEEGKRYSVDKSLPEMAGYTFDHFIVGNSNKFAHAAAVNVSQYPGKNYNPLFIYGNSGLGKTHLLLAIGQAIHENNPNARIEYIKGDDFVRDVVKSIREGKADDFRTKYEKVDLLLIDDIQFVAGKQQTQNEFFSIFTKTYEAGNQIVITSDRPPREMTLLDDRLRSRFESGLMADIQPPDLETRMAIIRNKAQQLGLVLSDEAVNHIAKKVTSNIRQLEGVIKKLTAYKEILNDVINIESVQKAIDDIARDGNDIPTPDRIIKETARYYSLKEEELIGQNKSKNIAMARHISMYLMRTLTNMTLNEIGSHFDKNHATVLASIRKIEDLLKTDNRMAGIVRDITSNITSQNSTFLS